MSESKIAFYREYRPKTFSEVVGQSHITRTLAHEVMSGRTAHAYIFAGSRGTGKTTCAKILAKAVNCPHAHEHGGDPCNECEICLGIDSGRILDVIELDAASNNGVEAMRSLIDECNYSPMTAKYKVYIIDEVHMLTKESFNAFLKTLEEPPDHVKFILATTDIHKVLPTILSRCQRFDFRRIEPDDIVERLLYIAERENLVIDREAASLIARVSDGALRNAVSILDQCSSFGAKIDTKVVITVTGLASRTHLFELIDCIRNSDSAAALDLISSLYASSCDMEQLCRQLIEHCRDLMVVRAVNDPDDLIMATNEEINAIKNQADQFDLSRIISIQQALSETNALMKDSSNKRILMETLMIKLCTPSLDRSVDALIARITALERSSGGERPAEKTYTKLPSGPIAEWPDILQELKRLNPPLYSLLFDSSAYVSEVINAVGKPAGRIFIKTDKTSVSDLLHSRDNEVDLRRAIFNVTGSKQGIKIDSSAVEKKVDPLDSFINKANEMNIFISLQ